MYQRSKRKFDKPALSLHPIPVTDTWNKVGIDLIELPVSSKGNRYVIILTNYFSDCRYYHQSANSGNALAVESYISLYSIVLCIIIVVSFMSLIHAKKTGGAGFPMIHRGAIFPEGKPNFLGNFTRGCRIPWGAEFPVTPVSLLYSCFHV